MLQGKKFGVISLGCDKNRVDTEKLLATIKERGYTLVNELERAQILIVNTCAFLSSARQEAIETILECAEYKNSGVLEKIVVTGCLPQKFIGEIFDGLIEADVFLGINDYDKIFQALEESYASGRQNFVGCGEDTFHTGRVLTTEPHYAYLKIADGCYNHCTYCLIPKIRGKYRSYPMELLVKEAEELGEISELVLVAQDVTRYGEDLYGQNRLVALIRALTALENIQAVRLLYCYPEMITDELIEELKTNEKLLKYLDIPLQHSENRVLKLMNRRGKREEYLSLFKKLRKNIPSIAIRSTFIAGFPTEREEEFESMKDFLRQARLLNCGFFAYSKEPDTGAARLSPQVHHATKKRRVNALYALQREISSEILQGFVGQKVQVLCDGIDYEKSCFVGRAYFSAPDIDGKVYFNASEAVQGEYYEVLIQSADAYDLYGKTEDYEE